MRFQLLVVERTVGTIVIEAKDEKEARRIARQGPKDNEFIDIECIGTTVKRVLPFPEGQEFVRS